MRMEKHEDDDGKDDSEFFYCGRISLCACVLYNPCDEETLPDI